MPRTPRWHDWESKRRSGRLLPPCGSGLNVMGCRFYQLERQSRHYAPAKGQVVVCEAQDGSLAIEYRGCALRWQEIPPPLRPTSEDARAPRHAGAAPVPRLAKRKWAPPADHPWRWAARRREIEKAVSAGLPLSPPPSLALPCASP